MPKLKNLLIAVAAMLSTSAALTDTKADDRSYLPPQDLQAQAKESGVQAAPQAEPGLRNTHYGTPPRYTRRHYAQRHTRRHFFPGIFFKAFPEKSSSFFAGVSVLPGGFSSTWFLRFRIVVPVDFGTDEAATRSTQLPTLQGTFSS